MAFDFKPGIYKSTTFTALPTPVTQLQASHSWDFNESKVPKNDGVETYGWSQNGVSIQLAGQFAIDPSGTATYTEEDMFGEVEDLKTLLDVSASSDKYEFFVYHDTGSATYRKFKNCVARNFVWENGDNVHTLFTYACELLSEDPTIYTTAPGS